MKLNNKNDRNRYRILCSIIAAPMVLAGQFPVTAHSDEPVQSPRKYMVDYASLVQYYQDQTQGLIQPNLFPSLKLKGSEQLQADFAFNLTNLKFKVNLDKMTITPDVPLDPESAQSLFNFSPEAYRLKYQGRDFVDAKVKYYSGLRYDDETQHYERPVALLSDWKSLNHPPVRSVGDTTEELDSFYRTHHEIDPSSKMLTAEFNHKMDELTQSELTRGNKATLLVNMDSYHEKLKRVKAAKKSIYVGVMSFASDPTSFHMIDALEAKVKEGVEVQVMLEKLWTVTAFRKTMKRFENSGIKLLLADDMYHLRGKKRQLYHNKVWIFDDEVAIVGGQNIVNSANSSTGFNHWNKDTDVLIEGPLATDVLSEYTTLIERYDFAGRTGRSIAELRNVVASKKAQERAQGLRGTENYNQWFSDVNTATNGTCRFVIQGPQNDKHMLSKAYTEFFKQAKKELFFTSQHIEYDINGVDEDQEIHVSAGWTEKMYHALFGAAKRGARIDLLANGIDGGFAEIGQNIAKGRDNPKREARRQKRFEKQIAKGEEPSTFMQRLSTKLGLKSTKKFMIYLDDVITRSNFNAWMHFQYIHTKAVLVDNVMSSIGSFNFEPYSADSSQESAVFCFDQSLNHQLKKDLIRDIVNSTPVLPPNEERISTKLSDNSTH